MSATNTQSHEDRQVLARDQAATARATRSRSVNDIFLPTVHYSSRSCRQCFLALNVPLKLHETPHGWMVTLELWLQPVVPPLDAVGAASYAAGPCSVLIPGCDGECGCTISRCTSSSSAARNVSVYEICPKLLFMTNRKLHMRFRLIPRSTTLDDLVL